jgi:hypothetical protein
VVELSGSDLLMTCSVVTSYSDDLGESVAPFVAVAIVGIKDDWTALLVAFASPCSVKFVLA